MFVRSCDMMGNGCLKMVTKIGVTILWLPWLHNQYYGYHGYTIQLEKLQLIYTFSDLNEIEQNHCHVRPLSLKQKWLEQHNTITLF